MIIPCGSGRKKDVRKMSWFLICGSRRILIIVEVVRTELFSWGGNITEGKLWLKTDPKRCLLSWIWEELKRWKGDQVRKNSKPAGGDVSPGKEQDLVMKRSIK